MKLRIPASLLLCVAVIFSIGSARADSKMKGAQKGAKHAETHAVDPDTITWGPAPNSMPPGAEVAVIDGEMSKKGSLFTLRIKIPDGYKVPPHFHPADEHVTVLSGVLYMGLGDKIDESMAQEMRPGAFHAVPKGVHHYAFSKGATVIQVHGIGPWGITYVNPADDPRKKRASK